MIIANRNLTPGMVVLLVILAILFAFIIVPILIIGGFCWLVCQAVTGSSPAELYLRNKARRHARNYEGPFERETPPQDENSASADGDDTIECEVISARTLDENGHEIH